MREVFINLQLGTLLQTVYIKDQDLNIIELTRCSIQEIPQHIPLNVDTVHFSGNPIFFSKLKRQIQQNEITQFGQNHINFKIEGEE